MESSSYFKVRINTIVAEKPTTFDLFLKINDQNILFLRAGDKLDGEKIKKLTNKDSGQHFWVKEEDRKAYKTYVHEQMISGDLDTLQKSRVLRESSMTLVE